VLDRAYGELDVDFVELKGTFGPELIKHLSKEWTIPTNFMFIGSPGNKFPHKISDTAWSQINYLTGILHILNSILFMKYYSVTYQVQKDGEILKTETVGVKSKEELATDDFRPILIALMKIDVALNLVVTDKLDIGEIDYLRLEKRFMY
jgi:hypothetical protein